MRVVVIGATGHVGTYLVPYLVEAGHEVVAISRQERKPYQPNGAWNFVKSVQIDRVQSEADGSFGRQIAALEPDVVVDMISFTLESTQHLVDAMRGNVEHFLHCGTVWVHGPSGVVPTTEETPRKPFGEYGLQKAAIEAFLLREARLSGFPATVLHPGHIVGPGWHPLNPAGHFNPAVFDTLARGDELALPNFGLETVHHVHADDVAQIFMRALARPSASIGESFHAVSPNAISLRGYAEAMARWFGIEANLTYLPWDEWKQTVTEDEARTTFDHIQHCPSCSIEKARHLLDYRPRYTSLQGVQEAVHWLMDEGIVLAEQPTISRQGA